jgi:hypothetical protein
MTTRIDRWPDGKGGIARAGFHGLAVVWGLLFLSAAWADDSPIPVMGRSSWDPSGGDSDWSKMKKHGRPLFSLVLHHTQTPNEAAAMERARLRGIRQYHQNEKAWGEVAYHYFIGAAGTVYAGRDWQYAGDSGTRYDLEGRLLVCVLGDFTKRRPSDEALGILIRVVVAKLREHGLTPEAVVTHRMVAATDCPGDELQRWYESEGRAAIAKAFAERPGARGKG